MKVIYMAAALSPIDGETREGNIARAKKLYRDLCIDHEGLFLAGWILNCEVFDESPEARFLGMQRNLRTIELCDELWMVGPRVSNGMQEEAEHAVKCCVVVHDRTDEPTFG